MELWGKDLAFRGAVSPVFFTRAGESIALPQEFERAVAQITAAACCLGCRHSHLLSPERIAASLVRDFEELNSGSATVATVETGVA